MAVFSKEHGFVSLPFVVTLSIVVCNTRWRFVAATCSSSHAKTVGLTGL